MPSLLRLILHKGRTNRRMMGLLILIRTPKQKTKAKHRSINCNRSVVTVEREGYAPIAIDELTAEDLTGARIYGAGDEDVGEISELLMTDDGKIDRAVIDVGGFLGMGERSVAVTFDELQIIRTDDGSDVRIYIDSTEEALKQQPEYEG